jgi:hypothetical protein
MSIIWASHDLNAVYKIANKVACINRNMFFHGDPPEFFENQELLKMYSESSMQAHMQFHLPSKDNGRFYLIIILTSISNFHRLLYKRLINRKFNPSRIFSIPRTYFLSLIILLVYSMRLKYESLAINPDINN